MEQNIVKHVRFIRFAMVNKLERTKFDMKEGCLFNYSESDKHDLIQERLKAAIELSIHSKSCIS